MTEYELFCRQQAEVRGINADYAAAVANSEGGLKEAARLGDFSGPPWYSGKSWWAFQLHYGGPGYEHFGHTAGMGNSFTKATGWQPGDPRAWRDAMRWALDGVRRGGWGPWYGAAKIGITGMAGVDSSVKVLEYSIRGKDGLAFRSFSPSWDFEKALPGGVPGPLLYNADAPAEIQVQSWACAIRTTAWVLKALGHYHGDIGALQDEMVGTGRVNAAVGLNDARGYGIKDTLAAHLPAGTKVEVWETITWEQLSTMAGKGPIALGGRGWGPGGHWSGVRKLATDGSLLLANPAPGYGGVHGALTHEQFETRGPWSAVRVPVEAAVPKPPPPAPEPEHYCSGMAGRDAQIAALREEVKSLKDTLYVYRDDVSAQIRELAEEKVGPKAK